MITPASMILAFLPVAVPDLSTAPRARFPITSAQDALDHLQASTARLEAACKRTELLSLLPEAKPARGTND